MVRDRVVCDLLAIGVDGAALIRFRSDPVVGSITVRAGSSSAVEAFDTQGGNDRID